MRLNWIYQSISNICGGQTPISHNNKTSCFKLCRSPLCATAAVTHWTMSTRLLSVSCAVWHCDYSFGSIGSFGSLGGASFDWTRFSLSCQCSVRLGSEEFGSQVNSLTSLLCLSSYFGSIFVTQWHKLPCWERPVFSGDAAVGMWFGGCHMIVGNINLRILGFTLKCDIMIG